MSEKPQRGGKKGKEREREEPARSRHPLGHAGDPFIPREIRAGKKITGLTHSTPRFFLARSAFFCAPFSPINAANKNNERPPAPLPQPPSSLARSPRGVRQGAPPTHGREGGCCLKPQAANERIRDSGVYPACPSTPAHLPRPVLLLFLFGRVNGRDAEIKRDAFDLSTPGATGFPNTRAFHVPIPLGSA